MSRLASLTIIVILALALPIGLGLSELSCAEQPDEIKPPVPVVTSGNFPKIQFDKLVHDFGKVSQQEALEKTFVFKNVGNATLNIQRVKAG